MKIEGQGKLLRIFIGEGDRYRGKLLYESILMKVREMGMAGCTVLRGIEGFGAGSRVVHTAKILRLSEDLPVVIEIADTEERIQSALSELEAMINEAGCGVMITLEKVDILHYKS